jgi:transposase-like protein
MTGTRKQYSAAFKARVALEAAKSTRTLAELSRAFQVHPVQVSQWKKEAGIAVGRSIQGSRREASAFSSGSGVASQTCTVASRP